MRRLFYMFILVLTLSFSNEDINKTSQLEVFLFKVGFQGLLNDVENIKMKSNMNTKDLENLTNKMEFIVTEITKNKTSLIENNNDYTSNQEVTDLKVMVKILEERINNLENSLKEVNKEKTKEIYVRPKKTVIIKDNILQAKITTDISKVYSKPMLGSRVIEALKKDRVITLKYCNKYGWCKMNDQSGYVKRYLLKIIKNN